MIQSFMWCFLLSAKIFQAFAISEALMNNDPRNRMSSDCVSRQDLVSSLRGDLLVG